MAGGRAEDIQQLVVRELGQEAEQVMEAAVPSPALPPHPGKEPPNTSRANPAAAGAMQKFAEGKTRFKQAVGFSFSQFQHLSKSGGTFQASMTSF